jgi:CheY-like chemotaxis protein
VSCVLAIESHAEGAAALRALLRDRVREPVTVVHSIDAALRAISQRVPEVILISPLLAPQDEAELVARLRSLPRASYVQTLIAPQLTHGVATAGSRTAAEYEPTAFASELATYVDMVRRQRVDFAAPDELSPSERRAAVRVPSVRATRLAVDGTAVDVVDLSVTGAQVLAPSLLVPRRTVQVLVEDRRRAMQCEAEIVWGALEAGRTAAGLQYRAGLDFRNGDRAFLERLCTGNRITPAILDVPGSFGRVLFTTT